METRMLRPMPQQGARFLNFLRGMETPMGLRVLTGEAPFLNFLRGMETIVCIYNTNSPKMLPKLP